MYIRLFYKFQHCSFCVVFCFFVSAFSFLFLFYTKRNDLARLTVNYAGVGSMQCLNLIDDLCASDGTDGI